MPNTRFPIDPVLGVKSSATSGGGDVNTTAAGLGPQFAVGTTLIYSFNRKGIYLLNGAVTLTAATTVSFAASFTATGGGGGDLRAIVGSAGTILPGEYFWAYSSVPFLNP